MPTSEQAEIRGRFRSGDNILFGTAFQELLLQEFLGRQHCELDFHPGIPSTPPNPTDTSIPTTSAGLSYGLGGPA